MPQSSKDPDAIVAGKVLDFLERIRGLNSLPPKDLQKLLYDRRFELLGSLNTSDTAAAESESKDLLPEYSTIPNQHELHEALLGGVIPSGYQCVAHVLYPDSVPWPIQVATPGEAAMEIVAAEVDPTQAPAPAASVAAAANSSTGSRKNRGESEEAKLATDTDALQKSDGNGSHPPEESSGALTPVSPKQPADAEGAESLETTRQPRAIVRTETKDEQSAQFLLCGQKVVSTVRGKPVQEMSEDAIALYMKATEDDRYVAAKEERIRLERAVKLEHYNETKVLEKIRNLELLRGAEIEHQREIRKREADRRARKEVLKKDLEAAWTVKLEKEKVERELAKEKTQKQLEEKNKWQRNCEKQKEVVTEWYSKQASQAIDEKDLASQQAEQLAKQKALERERERKLKPKTVKAQLAAEKIQRQQQASEQRPPLPPRPHDLARPVADLLEDSMASSSAGRPAILPPTRNTPVSWTREAKVVSDAYGLTPRDYTAVENRLTRNVQGSGRMAKYESI